ncbi:hypothetical protein NLG97_g8075 [Lecanicillium saksenae]|uniref:Uncharacterized protein n=1 Tax=Lecanicillium saksenae TaxID=468837 RepID=A0ACC1QLJ8_9HYPO|nr:hypothetical protein NLG97_g8075 [Lecanicillium saksenae]
MQEMVINRRASIGVTPLYALLEYCYDIEIEDKVLEIPEVRELEILGADMVFITNDIVSYRKEETATLPDNIIAIARLQGMSAQEAFDAAGALLDDLYCQWELVEKRATSLRTGNSLHLQKYINGIKNIVRANLYWSFDTDRYMKNPTAVLKTNKMEVLMEPAYLQAFRDA